MSEEVRLLEGLGVKPSIEHMEELIPENVAYPVDQTTSGKLTVGSIEKAMNRTKEVKSIIIPARHQYNIRRDELFTEYNPEKVKKGIIGRFMDAAVIVDEELDRKKDETAAYLLEKNGEHAVKILLAQ